MTINLQTLQCNECGSGDLRRVEHNRYACGHCGSQTLIEDSVSERLDLLLKQIRHYAAQDLGEQLHRRQERVVRRMTWAAVGCFALVSAFVGLNALLAERTAGSATSVINWLAGDQLLDTAGLRLDAPRKVVIGSGSEASTKLLVVAHNDTRRPLERPAIDASFFNGADRLQSNTGELPLGVLLPGESVPLLIDLPVFGARPTRAEVKAKTLRVADAIRSGPPAALEDTRLVNEGDRHLRFHARLINNDRSATLSGAEVLVVLYDAAGQVAGLGKGYPQAADLKPGERSVVDVSVEHFSGSPPIAAWDYRVDYGLLDADGARTAIASAQRIVRRAIAPDRG